jgi:hypothetical protein
MAEQKCKNKITRKKSAVLRENSPSISILTLSNNVQIFEGSMVNDY